MATFRIIVKDTGKWANADLIAQVKAKCDATTVFCEWRSLQFHEAVMEVTCEFVKIQKWYQEVASPPFPPMTLLHYKEL